MVPSGSRLRQGPIVAAMTGAAWWTTPTLKMRGLRAQVTF